MSIRVASVLLAAACISRISAANALAAAAPQSGDPIIASPATIAFTNVPFLPNCMKVAVVQGDPRRGPAIYLAKLESGCVIPWHWHTANTQLIFVSGHAKHWLKGPNGERALGAGDFIYLPAHHLHKAQCIDGCLVYTILDRADVGHYVDREGKDISPAQAFQSGARP